MSQTLNKGEGVQIVCQQMKVGLSWDIFEGQSDVDLDASCVLFNEFGVILDAAFYNKKETDDKSVVHSGDCKDGKIEGDDETIIIDFTKMTQKVKAIMVVVNAYQGGNFSSVETAEVNISDILLKSPIVSMSLGRKGNHTGLIMCMIFKDDFNNWHIKNIDRTCGGKNFKDVEFEMKEELYFLIPPEIMAEVKYDPKQQKSFNMKKEQILNIPTGNYSIGLGWDTKCDVDASCALLVGDSLAAEFIYFGNKKSKDNSVQHMGDNLTGEGSGDDETIHVNLKKVDKKFERIIFTVTIYSAGYTFKDVKGAYIRIIDQQQKKEICRYKLSGKYETNAMIMSSMFKNPKTGEWKFKAIGEGVKGNSIMELKSIIKKGKVKASKPSNPQVSEKIKKLTAEVKEAQNLKRMVLNCYAKNCDKKDFFGLSDPYFIIKVNENKIYQSEAIDNTLNPKWNRGLISQIDSNSTLEIQVYDHNSILAHQLIGNCSVKLNDLLNKNSYFKYDLIHPKKKYTSSKKNSGEFYTSIAEYQGPIQKLKELKLIEEQYQRELKESNDKIVHFFE